MEYNVFKKQTVSGTTTKTTTTKGTLQEAKQNYHSALNQAYADSNLEYVLCMIINDIGGIEMKEVFQKSYEVTFNGNGAAGKMAKQTFIAREAQSLMANEFVYADKTFVGWATDASATVAEYTDEQKVEISADTTLYAIWA